MKKILYLLIAVFLIAINSVCFANAPEPTKKVVLFYKVSDVILQCQNNDEDMVKGAAELEKELYDHYSKRFIVQEVRRAPNEYLDAAGYQKLIKPYQLPLVVRIDLVGEGTSVDYYQNAYGAKAAGVAPTITIHLVEALPAAPNEQFYMYDYGNIPYGAGTIAVGRNIYNIQDDPRKLTKNAVRASFRDACKLNEDINKYVNPAGYQKELNRFKGDFKVISDNAKAKISGKKEIQVFNNITADANERIERFRAWAKADPSRNPYLVAIDNIGDTDKKLFFIDTSIKLGVYAEI